VFNSTGPPLSKTAPTVPFVPKASAKEGEGYKGFTVMIQRKTVFTQLIDVPTAAHYLGVSVHTLYKMVSQRRIPYIKVGSRVKFDPLKLEEWIKQQTVMPMPSR